MNNNRSRLGTMPMGKLVFQTSVPLMISMLVQSLYNIVDSIFVSRISENALTATSIAYPAQMLMLAVAIGTGVGVNSLLSRRLGQKDTEGANNVATIGLVLAVLCSLIFMIFGIFGTGVFIRAFTDSEEIADYGIKYLRICMIGCAGIFLATTGERLLQATGNTFLSMIAQSIGAVVNIILDPILIFGLFGMPKMGIQGAAVATIIGQWAAAAASLLLNAKKNHEIHFKFKNFQMDFSVVKEIYVVGVPTMLMQTMGSIMMVCMNAFLIRFSSTAVAAFGVYYKLQSFVFMPVSGLSQGLIPIIGYNYGAKDGKRVTDAFRITVITAVIINVIGTILFQIFTTPLLRLYGAGEQMLEIGVPMLRIMSAVFPLTAITTSIGFTCSGLGNGMVSMVGTLLRQLVLLVPLAYVFGNLWGVDCVWYAAWISETVAVLFAIFSLLGQYRKKVKPLMGRQ